MAVKGEGVQMNTVTRVSGEGRKMPAPSATVIERMARAIHLATDDWYEQLGLQGLDDWDQLSETGKDRFLISARAGYASLACQVGADVKIIKEPEP